MAEKETYQSLRESIRILERKLGLLNEIQASCCGVTFAQCHAIVEIGRAGSLSLNDLAGILDLDKSTMSRTINNLVHNGLVVREPDPKDRRYIIICLSERGQEVYRNIEDSMNRYFEIVFNNIPENKRDQVMEGMELLLTAIEESRDCKGCFIE